jgi:NAD(P)-dependent dehydrogenase (short-subunit alcohol dehydrogenase family)
VVWYASTAGQRVDLDTDNRIVTGASSGIGRAFAEFLSKKTDGTRLVATARKAASLDYLPSTGDILKLALDLSTPAAIAHAVKQSVDSFGRIDVLVNNAAWFVLGDTEATTDDQARGVFETVFWGAASLTREVVRVMREENPKSGAAGGVAVYMSSPGDRVAFPGGSYYFAA